MPFRLLHPRPICNRSPLHRRIAFALIALAGLQGGAALADEDAAFDRCIAGLQEQARAEGRSPRVVDEVVPGLRMVPRVIELDRRQPEFTETFTNYFNQRVTTARVMRGRALLREHRELLQQLASEYGVPPQYLVAFWGLETNYGSYLGRMPVLDSLATLACDQRRSRYFTGELMAALALIDDKGIEPGRMAGSWAGAMGHTQFMPSAYRRYAVDGDGDGRIDLWNSIPDALASGAHFLQQLGWQPGLRWGREVRLPRDFPFEHSGLDNRQALSAWRALGVTLADGAPLADSDLEAALIVPAGHRGPAFLVYRNFDVIMRWNRSQFYALAVGHLADRINGAGTLQQTLPDLPRLSNAQVGALQQRLNEKGFDAGEADGILGPATRGAIRGFQRERGMVADGYPDTSVFRALGVEI